MKAFYPYIAGGRGGGSQNDPPPVFLEISQRRMKHFQQVFRGEGLKIGVNWKKIN